MKEFVLHRALTMVPSVPSTHSSWLWLLSQLVAAPLLFCHLTRYPSIYNIYNTCKVNGKGVILTLNDMKIPEIFQIWTWRPWLHPRDLDHVQIFISIHSVGILPNFTARWRIWIFDKNWEKMKIKMVDGCHFENLKCAITRLWIVRSSPNFACRSWNKR